MSLNAMEQLWEAFDQCRNAETAFWYRASRLLEEGLVSVEDVGNVYGIHTETARKRLREWQQRLTVGRAMSSRDLREP